MAVAIALTAIVSLSYLTPVQNTPKILSVQSVTNTTIPSVSVNSETGIAYAAFARKDGNLTNIYLMSSSDGGNTFSEPVRVNRAADAAANMYNTIPVAFGPDGKVYVAWSINKEHPDFPFGIKEFRIASSSDGGKTFTPAVSPVPAVPEHARAFFDLAVSDSGTVFLSYLDPEPLLGGKEGFEVIGYPTGYKMVKSTDGGKTFGEVVTLDNQACVCCQTASVMGPEGEVYFAWRDLQYESDVKETNRADNPYNYGNANGTLFEKSSPIAHETIRDIKVMHTTDNAGGNAFSPEYKVNDDKWYLNAGPGIAFDSNDRLHAVWFTGSATAPDGIGYYYAYSDDKGQTFSEAVPLLTDEEFVPPTMASISVDSSDNVWIAFADQRSPEVLRYSAIKEGHQGSVHLVVIDKNQNVLFNDSIASGAIHEFVDISAAGNTAYLAWKEGGTTTKGGEAKFATVSLGA